jgi:hypothetical protein
MWEKAYTSNDVYVPGRQLSIMWWCGFLLLSLLKFCFMGHMAEG